MSIVGSEGNEILMPYVGFKGNKQSLFKSDKSASEPSGRFSVWTDLAINRFEPRTGRAVGPIQPGKRSSAGDACQPQRRG